MRIYITVTEEPLFLTPFLKSVISAKHKEIVGIGIAGGSALKVRNQGKIGYFVTLAIMTSPIQMIKRMFFLAAFRVFGMVNKQKNPLSIRKTALKYNIPVKEVKDVNNKRFLQYLRDLKPDIIINQAQAILKDEFLAIPKIGSLNRHGALLPKYRGRLAPFWAFLNCEKYTGLSIHFIEKSLDSGPIVVQKKIRIKRFDTFDSLLKKIFRIAPNAMCEAIDQLRKKDYKKRLIENDDSKSSYFTSPKISDAIRYRKVMLRRFLYGK